MIVEHAPIKGTNATITFNLLGRMPNVIWEGSGTRALTARVNSMHFAVHRVRKGRWRWALNRTKSHITQSGRVKSEVTKMAHGEVGCRKVAMNTIWSKAAQLDPSLWGNRRQIGGARR